MWASMCTHQAHMPSQVAVAFLGLLFLQKGSHRPSQLRAFAPLGKATFSGPRRIAERNCPITSLSHCPRVQARRVKVVVLATGKPKPQNPALPLMRSFLQKGSGSSLVGWLRACLTQLACHSQQIALTEGGRPVFPWLLFAFSSETSALHSPTSHILWRNLEHAVLGRHRGHHNEEQSNLLVWPCKAELLASFKLCSEKGSLPGAWAPSTSYRSERLFQGPRQSSNTAVQGVCRLSDYLPHLPSECSRRKSHFRNENKPPDSQGKHWKNNLCGLEHS